MNVRERDSCLRAVLCYKSLTTEDAIFKGLYGNLRVCLKYLKFIFFVNKIDLPYFLAYSLLFHVSAVFEAFSASQVSFWLENCSKLNCKRMIEYFRPVSIICTYAGGFACGGTPFLWTRMRLKCFT